MEPAHRRILTENLDVMQARLYIGAGLRGSFVAKKIFTFDEMEKIEAEAVEQSKVYRMVEGLKRKPLSAFGDFLECLRNNGHKDVADELEKDEKDWLLEMQAPDQQTKHYILKKFLGSKSLESSEKKTLYTDLILKKVFVEEKHERKLAEDKTEALKMRFLLVQHDMEEMRHVKEKEVMEKSVKIEKLNAQLRETRDNIAVNQALLADNNALTQKLHRKESEILQLRHGLESRKQKQRLLEEACEEKDRLVASLRDVNERLSQLMGKRGSTQATNASDVQQQVHALKANIESIEQNVSNYQQSIESTQKEIERLSKQEREIREVLGIAKNDLGDSLTSKIKEMMQKETEKADQMELVYEELDGILREKDNLQKRKQDLKTRVKELEVDNEILRSSLSHLKQMYIKETVVESRPGSAASNTTDQSNVSPGLNLLKQHMSRSATRLEKQYCIICRGEFVGDPCFYHPKPYRVDRWSCCDSRVPTSRGCTSGSHLPVENKGRFPLTKRNSSVS